MAFISVVILKWLDYPANTQYVSINENFTINDELLPRGNGLAVDQEMLIPDHTNAVVIADPVYYASTLQKGPTNEFDEVYTQNRKFAYTYSTERNSDEVIQACIDNQNRLANELLLPACDEKEYNALSSYITDKSVKKLELSADELAIQTKHSWIQKGILMNRQRNADLRANISQSPDITVGWITNVNQIPGYDS